MSISRTYGYVRYPLEIVCSLGAPFGVHTIGKLGQTQLAFVYKALVPEIDFDLDVTGAYADYCKKPSLNTAWDFC